MVEIIRNPKDFWKYNPAKLPKAIDFRATTVDIPLDERVKNKYQIMLSKMNRRKIKEMIDYWGDMRHTALNKLLYKEAAVCGAFKKFTEEYFKSVKAQRRI